MTFSPMSVYIRLSRFLMTPSCWAWPLVGTDLTVSDLSEPSPFLVVPGVFPPGFKTLSPKPGNSSSSMAPRLTMGRFLPNSTICETRPVWAFMGSRCLLPRGSLLAWSFFIPEEDKWCVLHSILSLEVLPIASKVPVMSVVCLYSGFLIEIPF